MNSCGSEMKLETWMTTRGIDQYGQFAVAKIQDVEFRFRLIEAETSYWLLDTPVTNAQYAAITGEMKDQVHTARYKPYHPVVNVSWHEAKAATRELGEKIGASTDLPSEPEWEYACLAGSEDCQAKKGEANFHGSGPGGTAPVRSYNPNRWGLYDMVGQVWEWTRTIWEGKK